MLGDVAWFVVKLFLACLASAATFDLCCSLFDKKPKVSDYEDDDDIEDEETWWEDTWWEDIELVEDKPQAKEKHNFFHYILLIGITALSIYVFILIIRL